MARQPRFFLPGYPQQVIQRGNNRHVIFADDADCACYRQKLIEACRRFHCRVHAWVFMNNHVHLLVTPDIEAGIGKVMQALGRSHVQYFNYRYHRTGTLWEGRYRAALLETDAYLFACSRYIELNPVRAGMVTPHVLCRQLGETREQRCRAYRAMFAGTPDAATVDAIREATNKAWVLGNDRFRLEVEDILQRQATPRPRGGDRKSASFRGRNRTIESDPIDW